MWMIYSSSIQNCIEDGNLFFRSALHFCSLTVHLQLRDGLVNVSPIYFFEPGGITGALNLSREQEAPFMKKEVVEDEQAQGFLHFFLSFFAQERTLYLAMQKDPAFKNSWFLSWLTESEIIQI